MTTRTRPQLVAHACHYLLPMPDGPTVAGVCKHCGATREFRAAWQYAEGQQPMVLNHVDAEARRIASQEYRVYERKRR